MQEIRKRMVIILSPNWNYIDDIIWVILSDLTKVFQEPLKTLYNLSLCEKVSGILYNTSEMMHHIHLLTWCIGLIYTCSLHQDEVEQLGSMNCFSDWNRVKWDFEVLWIKGPPHDILFLLLSSSEWEKQSWDRVDCSLCSPSPSLSLLYSPIKCHWWHHCSHRSFLCNLPIFEDQGVKRRGKQSSEVLVLLPLISWGTEVESIVFH